MRTIIFLVIFSIASNISSQTIITLDFETNTIKRSNISAIENQDPADLLKNYLEKKPHQTFKFEKDIYKKSLSKQVKVGDYLIFEISNFDKKGIADSVFISYNFFDRNVQEYGSVFRSILNRGLNQFEQTESGTQPEKEEQQASDPVADIGRFPAGIASEEDFQTFQACEILLNLYAVADTIELEEVLYKINTDQDLINNSELFSNNEILENPISEEELIISAFASTYPYDFPEQQMVDYLNEMFTEDFSKEELTLYIDQIQKEIEAKKQEEVKEKEEEDKQKADGSGTFLSANKKNIVFVPLQIPNKDITYLYLEGFKNKKRIYQRPIVLHNYGGFKVDFSAGFMTSFLKKNTYILKDTTVIEQSIPNGEEVEVNKNRIINSDEGDFFIGIGVLAHFYTRWGKRMNASLTTGFMLNTDSQINYLLGGSLILGLEQRFVLSGGLSLGRVTDISSQFTEGDLISTEISELPTRNIWRTGAFVGISYNF